MSKKQKKNIAPKPVAEKKAPEPAPVVMPEIKKPEYPFLSLANFWMQSLIITIIGFAIYCNSFSNEYAHDDGIVIVKNNYVQEGFAGIGKILTRDAYDSYYRQLNTTNQLSGGRYRPLSIVTFAIEQQIMGPIPESKVDSVNNAAQYGVHGAAEARLIGEMHVRHVVNVILYIFSVIILLYFLRYVIFPANPIAALLAALIFLVHPIHTEVVANVKSRDEIMSLLFMCLTMIYGYRYYESNKKPHLYLALLFYFLAFLSKEYAITLLILIPLQLYLFKGFSIKKSLMATLPYLIVVGIYIAIRLSIITPANENSDNEILNNPYLFAEGTEKIATEIATSLNYLKLLFFPHPLSADYSYAQIPYKDFSNPLVWLSLIVHGGLIAAMVYYFRKRHLLCFAIAFYLLHLALVCNIFFDIGATMGERLIYHSSVGFAIAVAYFLYKGYERIKPAMAAKASLAGAMVVIIGLCSFKTIERNADWKNDATLFLKDVKTVPNSVLANANAAASLITMYDNETKDTVKKREYITEAIADLNKAISLHPGFTAAFLNRGLAYYKLGYIDKAKDDFDSVRKLYPTYPTLPTVYGLLAEHYMRVGWNKYGKYGKYPEAIAEFKKGIDCAPNNPDLWYNLGGAYYSNHQYQEAAAAWQKTLQLNKDYKQAREGLMALSAGMAPPPKPGEKQDKTAAPKK